jgi:hypothetical protein
MLKIFLEVTVGHIKCLYFCLILTKIWIRGSVRANTRSQSL